MNKAWFSCAALPLLVCCLQAASPVVAELPLPEKIYPGLDAILRQAVQQSPRMLAQSLNLEIAENNRIAARATLLPSLGASVSYYQSSDDYKYIYDPNSGSDNYVDTKQITKSPYNVSISQPVFHWGALRNSYKVVRIQQMIIKGQYRDGYRLLVNELRQAYLRAIISKVVLERARFYQQYAREQQAIAEERYGKKLISEAQIHAARLATERAEIAMEWAAFDYDSNRGSLVRLAGLSELPDDAIPHEVPRLIVSNEAFDTLLAAFNAKPELDTIEAQTKRHNIEIAKLGLANAKTRLRPKFNAVLGLNQDEQLNLLGIGSKYSVTSKYAGISMNWSLFDGFSTKANVSNARIGVQQLQNEYQQLTSDAAIAAKKQRKMVYFSARTASIEDRALASGEGELINKLEEFKRGGISDAELSQVRLTLFDTKSATYRARVDLLMKITEFLGTINEDPVLENLESSR